MTQPGVLPRTVAGLALVPLLAAALHAQLPGGFGRGRMTGRMTVDPGIEVVLPVNPVNLLVQNRAQLALTDSQFARIVVIKRQLDSANAPYLRRIDSVRSLFKRGPVFADPSTQRRDSILAGRAAVRESLADVEDNIADARERAYGLLVPAQLTKAEQMEERARKTGAAQAPHPT